MNVVLCTRAEVAPSGDIRLEGERARHLRDVLRVTPGQAVRLGLVDGPFGVGTVVSVEDDAVNLRGAFDDEVPSRPAVDLLLALPRPKVLRRLWAPLAAMGVGDVMLTNAARVERNYFDTHWLSPAAYTPLLIEGLQQARDTRLPVVTVHRQFRAIVEDGLADGPADTLRVVAHPGAGSSLADVVRAATTRRVLLAIGPEGGWNEFELQLLVEHGFAIAEMGSRRLRTDTACVAALAIVHACRRDVQPGA